MAYVYIQSIYSRSTELINYIQENILELIVNFEFKVNSDGYKKFRRQLQLRQMKQRLKGNKIEEKQKLNGLS